MACHLNQGDMPKKYARFKRIQIRRPDDAAAIYLTETVTWFAYY